MTAGCGGLNSSAIDLAGGVAQCSPIESGSETPFHLPSPLDSSEPVVLLWRGVWEEDRAMEQQTRTPAQTSRATK